MTDIIIYGRGKTGKSLAKLVKEQGYNPVFYDDENGFDDKRKFTPKDTVLLSPGVKPFVKGLIEAKKAGCKIISELEYCFGLCDSACISVTGTNGKTTVCEMIYHILKTFGRSVYLLGNGGTPFSEKVTSLSANDTIVLESSSFQLRNSFTFSPKVSVFVSLAPDHLDYHVSMEDYIAAKMNNFVHQSSCDYAVFNLDDVNVMNISECCKSTKLTYSIKDKADCYFDGNNIVLRFCGKTEYAYGEYLQGYAKHNLSDALAAFLVCRCEGISLKDSVTLLKTYRFLPHRLQLVRRIGNVLFVDDSKATNVHATVSALKNYDCNIALILGGSDKGENFDELFRNIGSNVLHIAAVGATAFKIKSSAEKFDVCVEVMSDIRKAVNSCYSVIRKSGGVVLMSNACASFDKFSGYAERGAYFQKIVGEINDEETN